MICFGNGNKNHGIGKKNGINVREVGGDYTYVKFQVDIFIFITLQGVSENTDTFHSFPSLAFLAGQT